MLLGLHVAGRARVHRLLLQVVHEAHLVLGDLQDVVVYYCGRQSSLSAASVGWYLGCIGWVVRRFLVVVWWHLRRSVHVEELVVVLVSCVDLGHELGGRVHALDAAGQDLVLLMHELTELSGLLQEFLRVVLARVADLVEPKDLVATLLDFSLLLAEGLDLLELLIQLLQFVLVAVFQLALLFALESLVALFLEGRIGRVVLLWLDLLVAEQTILFVRSWMLSIDCVVL